MALATHDTSVMLETLVDQHGLSNVLDMLAEICSEKKIHVQEVWQDARTAREWHKAARAVGKAASSVNLVL